jgi:DNA (cytosine-5)-methyltransferase 1
MKYFSAFTGIGGFDLATPKNWVCVGHSEIDKHANMVLKYRFPEVKNYGDIEKIRWEEVPDFDVLFGGTPCQDLSVAGKRTGLYGNKSRIFFEFVRALKEKKPEYFIWENVKGALSSNAGWDFARVLLEFSEAGYSVWWQVLNATDFGIPQHRERVFVIGALGNEPPTEIFFEQKSNGKDNEIQKQQVNTIRGQIENIVQSLNSAYRIYGIHGVAPTIHTKSGGYQVPKIAIPVLTPGRINKHQNGRRFKENDEPSFTLTAQDRHGIYDGYNIRYLTPLECERLMGLPDNWTKYGINDKNEVVEISDTHRYKLIGNAVVPVIVRNLIKLIDKS